MLRRIQNWMLAYTLTKLIQRHGEGPISLMLTLSGVSGEDYEVLVAWKRK